MSSPRSDLTSTRDNEDSTQVKWPKMHETFLFKALRVEPSDTKNALILMLDERGIAGRSSFETQSDVIREIGGSRSIINEIFSVKVKLST